MDFQAPIAVIPNLAIHLNREANQGWAINAQTELPPILAQLATGETREFRDLLAEQLTLEHGVNADAVLDYELSFYDTQSAAVIGLGGDFIAGARLDNLLSCYAGLQACWPPRATRAACWSAPTTRKSAPAPPVAPTARSWSRSCAA